MDLAKLDNGQTDGTDVKQKMTEDLLNYWHGHSNFGAFSEALKHYILWRLNLDNDVNEDAFDALMKMSLRKKIEGKNPAKSNQEVRDGGCHQYSYQTATKTLLMLEVERVLGLQLSWEETHDIQGLRDYAEALWNKRQEMENTNAV